MKKLTLTNYVQGTTTVLENEFIDRYMPTANGEYVKVYLLILRHLSNASGTLSISAMADLLDCTEKDVLRALKYWKKEGLLDYDDPDDTTQLTPEDPVSGTANQQAGASAIQTASTPSMCKESVPKASSDEVNSVSNIQQYRSRKERKEFKELLFVAEQYLGKTLSSVDIDMITYFFDSLHMSAELIEYLIEYCVENGHKSMRYIQKVALSWSEQNITTVEAAKSSSLQYNKNCYSILNAYGIKGRAPASSEIAYIRKWNEEYGFTLDIILEACDRTMNAIHQPSFEYADTILTRWHNSHVHHLKDISVLDDAYQKQKAVSAASAPKAKPVSRNLNNFERRSYDMDSLEEQLLNSN